MIANLAVILSGLTILLTGLRFADLIVGGAIGLYVIKGSIRDYRLSEGSWRKGASTINGVGSSSLLLGTLENRARGPGLHSRSDRRRIRRSARNQSHVQPLSYLIFNPRSQRPGATIQRVRSHLWTPHCHLGMCPEPPTRRPLCRGCLHYQCVLVHSIHVIR